MPLQINESTMMVKRLYYVLYDYQKDFIAAKLEKHRKETVEKRYLENFNTISSVYQEIITKYINLFLGTNYSIQQMCQAQINAQLDKKKVDIIFDLLINVKNDIINSNESNEEKLMVLTTSLKMSLEEIEAMRGT